MLQMIEEIPHSGCQINSMGQCVAHEDEVKKRRNTEILVNVLKESIIQTQLMIDDLQKMLSSYPALQKTVWIIAGTQAFTTLIITASFVYTTIVAGQAIDRTDKLVTVIQNTQYAGTLLMESVASLKAKIDRAEIDIIDARKDIKFNRDLHIKYDVPTTYNEKE